MGLGLGLAWSVDNTAQERLTTEGPSPDTIVAELP
jgi:hypothetical protein